jgi:Fur family transcriptional regulator, ferric uptake regulator
MSTSKQSSVKALAQRLREAGLRRTGPRVAVLERLARAKAPISHAELASDLELLGFDKATVYRNLMDLAEAGLVSRTDLGDHVWRFELRGDEGSHDKIHPHLICTDCGKVSCLPDVQVQVKVARNSRHTFNPAELEVQLRGRCDRCAA